MKNDEFITLKPYVDFSDLEDPRTIKMRERYCVSNKKMAKPLSQVIIDFDDFCDQRVRHELSALIRSKGEE